MRSGFYHFRSPGGADGRALRPAVRPVLVRRQRRRGVCERNRQPRRAGDRPHGEDFDVLEDGKPQTVSVFSAGDFPLSVAVALDRSFSMAGPRLAMARSAARVFLGELRAQDEAAILAIGSRVETVAPLSTDRAAQYRGARSNRRIRYDRTLRFGRPRDRADTAGKRPTRARRPVGWRRSVQHNDGGGVRSSRRAVPMSSCTRSLSPRRRRHSSRD